MCMFFYRRKRCCFVVSLLVWYLGYWHDMKKKKKKVTPNATTTFPCIPKPTKLQTEVRGKKYTKKQILLYFGLDDGMEKESIIIFQFTKKEKRAAKQFRQVCMF